MIMPIIYLSIAVFSIFLFYKKMYVGFLFAYLGLITGLFMLDTSGTTPAFCGDICILLNIIIIPILPARYKKADLESGRLKINYTYFPGKDVFARFIYIFFFFYLIEFAITVISGAESLVPAAKVIRLSLLPFAYLIFKCIPLNYINTFFRLGLYLTIFQGVLYYLQFIGIHLIAGYDKEKVALEGFSFAMNNPIFTVFYILYVLKSDSYGKLKYPIVMFLLGMVILTFTRAHIAAVLFGIALYLVLRGDRKQIMAALLGSMIVLPAVFLVFSTKSANRSSSTADDISNVLTDFSNIDLYNSHSGSFTFRTAMLVERFMYLLDNPEYLPFGVGSIHEDSPNCYNRFDFALGTVNTDKVYGQCLIESGDNTWVPITLRYGVAGIILHLSMLLLLFVLFLRRKDDLVIIAPLVIISFVDSFAGTFFENPQSLFMFIIFAAWAARANIEEKQITV